MSLAHEKREGNCRIVKFPGTALELPILWTHEDCPVCRAARAEARVKELEEAIFWALGCHGAWPERQEGQGKFYWRVELGDRAGLSAERINERALRGED
jgi:hypothetical protein